MDTAYEHRDAGFIPWSRSNSFGSAHTKGLGLLIKGRFEEAAQYFYSLVVDDPASVMSHYGYVWATQHRSLEAQRRALLMYAERVRQKGPLERLNQLAFAACLVEFEHQGGSVTPSVGVRQVAVRRLEQWSFEDDVAAALWAAKVFDFGGRQDLRRNVLTRWLAHDPRDFLVRHELANAYLMGTEIKSFPPHLPLEQIAELKRQAEGSRLRYDLSFREAKRVLAEAPEFAIAYMTAGVGAFCVGDKPRARAYFEEYLRRRPQGIQAARAKQYLEEIEAGTLDPAQETGQGRRHETHEKRERKR